MSWQVVGRRRQVLRCTRAITKRIVSKEREAHPNITDLVLNHSSRSSLRPCVYTGRAIPTIRDYWVFLIRQNADIQKEWKTSSGLSWHLFE